MSDENGSKRQGFKIKWADREVEYYGNSAKEVFDKVFEHVTNTPVYPSQAPQEPPLEEKRPPQIAQPTVSAFDNEYERIAKDSALTQEQVVDTIRFEKREDFTEPVPILPKHPDERTAVRLVAYAMQVGLQKSPIDILYLKKILKIHNGYPMPGRELSIILKDFRRDNVVIASQSQERNMPITLSSKGIDQARALLKGTKP